MNTQNLKVKICGITNIIDRDLVIAAGADYFGAIIEMPQSPRSIELPHAAVLFNVSGIQKVAVLVNPEEKLLGKVVEYLKPTAIQLHGNEPQEFCAGIKEKFGCRVWKALSVPAEITDIEARIKELNTAIQTYVQARIDTFILDTRIKTADGERTGGTGTRFSWDIIQKLELPTEVSLFVAGGINPDNVAELVGHFRIQGIDIGSGVESYPGKKDPLKIRKLMEVIRGAQSSKI